jgi:hypothetical protein
MTIEDLMQQIEETERLISVYRNVSEVVVGTQDQIYSRRGLINRTVLTAAEIGDQRRCRAWTRAETAPKGVAGGLSPGLGSLLLGRAHRDDLPARQGLRDKAGASVEPYPAVLLHLPARERASFLQENVHPLQGGYFRRKLRRERPAGLPRENPAVFYPRRVREVLQTHIKLAVFYLYLHRIRRRVERDPSPYSDPALAPIDGRAWTTSQSRREKATAGALA